MKTFYTALLFVLVCACTSTKTTVADDIAAIRAILDQQQRAWSANDLEGFMDGYWKSEELTYFSRGKIT